MRPECPPFGMKAREQAPERFAHNMAVTAQSVIFQQEGVLVPLPVLERVMRATVKGARMRAFAEARELPF
jgi:hypothetical protein